MSRIRALSMVGWAVAALLLAACTENVASDAAAPGITVASGDESCELDSTQAPSGNLVFSVENVGAQVTEFYLIGSDGLRVVAEVENVGPGITRELVVRVAPGEYFTVCKPGMTGAGIRAAFTVTDSGADLSPSGPLAEQIEAAATAYAAYVRDQAGQLVTGTESFVEAYLAGDDELARSLYAPTRMHWERIEPVAEAFGDLDPKLDLREADLEEGQQWTGWHRFEKDLWPPAEYEPLTQKEREALSASLSADTAELNRRVRSMSFTADQLGNGAKELLDEVATGKVTGEEEFWSHTDLWDFQANVDGARVMFGSLQPVLQQKDAELSRELESRFEELQDLLDKYRAGDGFVLYTALSDSQIRELAAAVDALAEPLSRLTAAVVL
jgi:iron uptake system component EfeO